MKPLAILFVTLGTALFLRTPIEFLQAQAAPTTPSQVSAAAGGHDPSGEELMTPLVEQFQIIKWLANESLAMAALFVGFLIWRRDLKGGLFASRDQNQILIDALADNTKVNARMAGAMERLAGSVAERSNCCEHCPRRFAP
jgi:hypothetical protein